MKKALITGIRGQDGAYLAKLLLAKGYDVYGADRRNSDGESWRLNYLGIEKDVEIVYMDLLELPRILDVIQCIKPDEIYNLAAQSFVKTSFDQPILTAQVNAIGVLNLLEAVRLFSPESKFYQASTSEMFGNELTDFTDQDSEEYRAQCIGTPFMPRSPYATAKLFAHNSTINYREAYGLFACCGILFNHESPLRGLEFVTRKITDGIAKIKTGKLDKLMLGNLNARRDWGYAPEYVEAMWQMMQYEKPIDRVIASGETHSIREFIECACNIVGIDIKWTGEGKDEKGIDSKTGKIVIEVAPEFYRPSDVEYLKGISNFQQYWKPSVSFAELVAIMLNADMERMTR